MIDLEKKDSSQEQQQVQNSAAAEIKPDIPSVGWVLLVLFILGPLGIIPAIVFFRSYRPKRALCCLIPALFYLVFFAIMLPVSINAAKNNPPHDTELPSSSVVSSVTVSEPIEESAEVMTNGADDENAGVISDITQDSQTYEPTAQEDDLAEIVSDIVGSDIPIVSGTNEYQIYQATMQYFENVRNHKVNYAQLTESDITSPNLSADAANLIQAQYAYAQQLMELFALADDDSDQRILYREALSHLDNVHAVIKSIEIDPSDPVVCPPILDNAAYVTLDIYYMDYIPVFQAVFNYINTYGLDDEKMSELISNSYEAYKDQIPYEELENRNEALLKSAMYAYLFNEFLYCAEPKVETDVLATLWHRDSGWEMEVVGLDLETGMNVYTAGLFIHPEY